MRRGSGWQTIYGDEWLANHSDYRVIEDAPDYFIRSDGEVFSRAKNWLNGPRKVEQQEMIVTATMKVPYMRVRLYRDGKVWPVLVHCLVARAFIGPRPVGMQVRHRDCDPHNNDLSNLAYGTPTQNSRDSAQLGRLPTGEAHHATILTNEEVREIRSRCATGESKALLAREFRISITTVKNIANYKTWRALE